MKSRACAGYALLAALVIVALAALAGASCLVAVGALQSVNRSERDTSGTAATGAEALALACAALRWAPSEVTGSIDTITAANEAAHADWRPFTAATSDTPTVSLSVTARRLAAQRRTSAVVELRAEGCAQGLVVAGDAVLAAPLGVSGTGAYVGGSLTGRELLTFTPDASGAVGTDGVHGDLWASAGAHAGGEIFARGFEIHAASPISIEWPHDTDAHTLGGTGDPAKLTIAPQRGLLVALAEHSVPLDGALSGGVLDLSRLPAHADSEPAPGPCRGLIVYVRPAAEEALTIVGVREAAACPVTLVVDGSAVIGLPDGPPTLSTGALVVTGLLKVSGPYVHVGHIYAGQLITSATTQVTVPADWRRHPPAGLTAPTIVRLAEP